MADGQVVFTTELDAAGIQQGLNGIDSTINKWGAAIVGSKAFSAITDALIDVAKAGIEYNAQMEAYQTNFGVLLGDQAAALEHVTELRDMAAATPFGMEDLASASQTLLSFGASADTVMDSITMLGDISLGNREKFSSLSLAFAQVSAAGKLTGQDLLQMVNAGFNPLNTIAEATGTSLGDLKDVMGGGSGSKEFRTQMKAAQKEVKKLGDQASDGAKLLAQIGQEGMISAEMVGIAMQMETSPGGRFYKGMEQASMTMSGMWSTLQDDAMQLAGNVFEPVSEALTDVLLPAAIGAVGALNELFEKDANISLSAETQEALTAVETLDQKIIGIQNKYTKESIKIKIDYEESLDLIDRLATIQETLQGVPQRLWSEQDQADLKALTAQLVELNPQLGEHVGKDGILKLEAEAVRELVTEYKNLALVQAAQKAQSAAWEAYYEAEVAAEKARVRLADLQVDLGMAQQSADAWGMLANAAAKASTALSGRTIDSIGVQEFTAWVDVARESMQSYIDMMGGLDTEMFTQAGIDTTAFFDGFNVLDTATLMNNEAALQSFAAALMLVGQAAQAQSETQLGTVEQLSAEVAANTDVVKAAEDAANVALENAETHTAVIDSLSNATSGTAEAADAAAEAVAGVQEAGEDLGEGKFEPEVGIDDQATEPIDKIRQDLASLKDRYITVYVNERRIGAGTTGIGSYAKGLDYVPYDDFPAYLHKGEMVLTAKEAEALRSLSDRNFAMGIASRAYNADAAQAAAGQTVVHQTINFNQPAQTPDEFAQMMREFATYGLAGR